MSYQGKVLLIGGDLEMVKELTPAMESRDFQLATVPDAKQGAAKLAAESFTAVLVDFVKVPPADREQLVKMHKEKGGFALLGLEPPMPLSPAVPAPMRRLPWPLPRGFVDQVRVVEVPVILLAEPTLFITQGVQNALRQAGVQFFQLDNSVGVVDMMREQVSRKDHATKPAKQQGFWERIAGSAPQEEAPQFLGTVAVSKFTGGPIEAQQFDARLRQALPNAVCYLISGLDPVRSAAPFVSAGQPVVLAREHAARSAELLADVRAAKSSKPREKERVLLVDNDMPTLSRLAESIMAAGYEVVTTVNGEEAMQLAQKKPFALAAIGGSALETTKLAGANLALKLREKDKDLRILLMVDQFPVQDALKGVSRAVELGLDDALLKPIDATRLVLSIQRALERRFLILENARLLSEVQESARKLAQVNGFQTKFFATVAHDVKNPLTAILGYSEVLGMRLKDMPTELKAASHIHSAAKTLNLLVSDLVDLAAIESGKLRVEIGALDLASVISEVKSRVDVVAQRKSLQLTVNAPAELPPLKGDAHRIGQVIQNLCTNAVQYTKENGKITIEVSVQKDWVLVGVRDTGIGISKEDLPRVWERFFQTKEAQNMRKAGFGLGLKIAREIVQMHGGDMGIESELGVGSFFYFKLPVPRPDGSLPAGVAIAPSAAPGPSASGMGPRPAAAPAPAPAPAPATAPVAQSRPASPAPAAAPAATPIPGAAGKPPAK